MMQHADKLLACLEMTKIALQRYWWSPPQQIANESTENTWLGGGVSFHKGRLLWACNNCSIAPWKK